MANELQAKCKESMHTFIYFKILFNLMVEVLTFIIKSSTRFAALFTALNSTETVKF